MDKNKYNKTLMAAVRAVLAVGGFLLGAGFTVLFFRYNPSAVKDYLKIIFVASGGLLLGLTLLLSSRPIVALVAVMASSLKKFFSAKAPAEVAGFVLGICVGLLLTLVIYVVLEVFVPIKPLNIALTVLCALLFCFVGAFVFARTLKAAESEPEESGEEVVETGFRGYILTSKAFFDPRAEMLVGKWLHGKLVVLAKSVGKFAEAEEETALAALKTYCVLVAQCKLKTVEFDKGGSEEEDVMRYAATRSLAVVTSGEIDPALCNEKVRVLDLSAL